MKITIEHAGTRIEIDDPDKKTWEIKTIEHMTIFLTNQIKGLQNQVRSFSENKVSLPDLRENNSTNQEEDGGGQYSNKIGFIK